MNKTGPIVVIEDDPDDQYILNDIFSEIGLENAIVFCDSGKDALQFLRQEKVTPFLILSDINMPMMDGFDLRNTIFMDESLRKKCVPYLFFTTSSNEKIVTKAYALSIQGFFVKPDSGQGLKSMISNIINYWKDSVGPLIS